MSQAEKSPFSSRWQSTTLLARLVLAGQPKTPCVVNCTHVDHNQSHEPLPFQISMYTNIIQLLKIFFVTLYGRLSIL